MERRSEQDTDQPGLPLSPGSREAPPRTPEDSRRQYVQQYAQQYRSSSPRRGPGYVPTTLQRSDAYAVFRSGHRRRPLPTMPRLAIPREPLSQEELRQRLQTVASRLQVTPDAANSASADEANNECGICQDVLVGSEANSPAAIKFNHCKHALHEECMVEWIDWVQRNRGPLHQAACPNCRRLIFAREISIQNGRTREPELQGRPRLARTGWTDGLMQIGQGQGRELLMVLDDSESGDSDVDYDESFPEDSEW
jgi:hypothetical protein